MTLRVIDTNKIWTGERVRGILYTDQIEFKFSDEELLKAGFERVVEEPIEQPIINEDLFPTNSETEDI